jgi:hypothetical protein
VANSTSGVSGKSQGSPSSAIKGGRAKLAAGEFHPTVVSLMVLVVAEYAAYLGLRYYFRHAHGG